MAPTARLCLLPLRPLASSASGATTTPTIATRLALARALHTNPPQPAKVAPVYGTGPPPEPPQPSDEFAAEERAARVARRRRQAELLKRAGDIKGLRQQQQQQQKDAAGGAKGKAGESGGLIRRFWKDVNVKEVDGALEIHLDARPLRHPTTKAIIRLPPTKPQLAHALAVEWDSLVSAQQATKQHLIPLSSLICRALDISTDDTTPTPTIRPGLATTLLRYLDTDSLLCFAPPPPPRAHHPTPHGPPDPRQEAAYASTVSYLTATLWPGISLHPVLDGTSIFPRPQARGAREIVHGWLLSLSAFELAAVERTTLAGKSLLAAARLVAEWSEEGASRAATDKGKPEKEVEEARFGVEEAAQAVSLEVVWQTGRWGEVEDTHDVEKEDLRRQLGSAVLLVSGTGNGTGTGNGNGSSKSG
ncbi:protein atp12, mitochondrial [Staphylotrichum tortipilum]|uniref:Protein atp12, mitochondrial n=1 Tax=Staphylotrichum tortipilum TaxID=2831512 RepID=A0AAN6RW80_9PEZI|nr:protein atp12, mitochondrial [Staphylotrichum longicolle]